MAGLLAARGRSPRYPRSRARVRAGARPFACRRPADIFRRMTMTPTRLRECIALPGWSLRKLSRVLGVRSDATLQLGSGKRPIAPELATWLDELAAVWETAAVRPARHSPTNGMRRRQVRQATSRHAADHGCRGSAARGGGAVPCRTSSSGGVAGVRSVARSRCGTGYAMTPEPKRQATMPLAWREW